MFSKGDRIKVTEEFAQDEIILQVGDKGTVLGYVKTFGRSILVVSWDFDEDDERIPYLHNGSSSCSGHDCYNISYENFDYISLDLPVTIIKGEKYV
jgi:hypothetical protein